MKTKDTRGEVLENVLLGLLSAALGHGLSLTSSIGIPPSFSVPWGSRDPAGIGLIALMVICVGFVCAGRWKSWLAFVYVPLFGAGMIPMIVHRLDVHRATALWTAFHPYGSALVLLGPGILAALVGVGLGVLTRRLVSPTGAEVAPVVAERRARHGTQLKFIGLILLLAPIVIGLVVSALLGERASGEGVGQMLITLVGIFTWPVGLVLILLAWRRSRRATLSTPERTRGTS